MNSKTLAAGLIASWLFIMLSGATHAVVKPAAPANADETRTELRQYV